MKATQFHVTFEVPEGSEPIHAEMAGSPPERVAQVIQQILLHRAPYLFGGGGKVKVHVTPEATKPKET